MREQKNWKKKIKGKKLEKNQETGETKCSGKQKQEYTPKRKKKE